MSTRDPKITVWKLRSSYFTSIISISLVLFLLGSAGLLILNAKKLSDFVKENIIISIFLKDESKEVDIYALQKMLDAQPYVKATKFITKDEAAKELETELGEDFVKFLGYNPLAASIEVNLYADFANPDSLIKIEKYFTNFSQVKEVYYQKSLIEVINKNVSKISSIIAAFSIMLFIIALTLINNTIRLSVYSKRFIIHTMQLVGATKGFIRKPFLFKSILHGILAALFAISLLTGMIYLAEQELSGIITLQDINIVATLYGMVLIIGILINLLSTFFAVNRYLRIDIDKLYY